MGVTSTSEEKGTSSQPRSVFLLWTLAVGFFLIALVGAFVIGYLLNAPTSSIAVSLTELFQTAEGPPPDQTAVGGVIDLLVNGVGVAGSLAVSLALAAIYLSQNRILDQQTTIQDQQAWIMKRQHVPFLASHPDGVQLHAGRPSLEMNSTEKTLKIAEGDAGTWVSVGVENHGDETAEQIQLACLIDFPNIEEDPPLYPHVCELEADGMITKPPQSEGALLPPNQGITLLRGLPRFSLGPDQDADFAMFCGDLQEQLLEEGNRVRFGFVLIYANAMGQLFRVPLDDAYTALPDSFADLNELEVKHLTERTGSYEIEQLIDDLNWEIPAHAFKSWDDAWVAEVE